MPLVVSIILLALPRPVLQTQDYNRRMRLCAHHLVLGVIRKRVRLAEIVGCEPIRIRWWYGWGIHLTPCGWLYNVSGLRRRSDHVARWQKIRARAPMILTGSRQEFETQFASLGCVSALGSGRRGDLASASSRSRTLLSCSAVNHPLRKACFGATPKASTPEACATLLQLAEPA